MKGLIYLASPYSHAEESVREARWLAVMEAAAIMMRAGHHVYSPIAHSHPIAVRHNLPTDWEFWNRQCEIWLVRCDSIAVLMIEGWKESVGIAAELEIAKRLGVPVYFIQVKEGQILNVEVEG